MLSPLYRSMTQMGTATGGASNGLLANLVGYWPLNEAAGANDALDKHSGGLTLTQINSPGSAAGLVYGAARVCVNASAQYFIRASETLLQTGNVDWTISAWIRPTDAASRMIVTKMASSGAGEFQIYRQSTGKLYADVRSASTLRASVLSVETIALNEWSFVVVSHDSTAKTLSAYINNSAGTTGAPWTVAPGTSTDAFTVGAYASGNFGWGGRIGPVTMHKSAAGGGGILSAAQLTSLWNAGAGLTYSAFS